MVAIAGLKPAAYKRRTGSSPVSRTKYGVEASMVMQWTVNPPP